MNSEVSERMLVPPAATTRSLIAPMAGLAARPLVGSGTAAFRADDQLGDREFLSLEQTRLGDHLLGVRDRLLDGLERAARLLNDHALHGLAGALGDCLRDQIHLAVFAAERYEDRAVDIRVGRIARHDIHGKLLVDRDLRAAPC